MPNVELTHPASGNHATVVPERGAIVTQLFLRGKERLYLDDSTLSDPSKNVRGGIPILFPAPGKLEGGRFTRNGKSGAMKQHGFARDLPWTVANRTENMSVFTLTSTDATRAMFPWDFSLSLTATLGESALVLRFRVGNTGKEAMPFGLGIHPYFLVHDKAGASISTAATRAFDNVSKHLLLFHGFDLMAPEVDLHLLDHGSSESTLAADESLVTVRTQPDFARWVVWTLAGKDFVCLEPWTAPGDALNTGESLTLLPPGDAATFEITVEARA